MYRRPAFVAPGPAFVPIIVDSQVVSQIAIGTYAEVDIPPGDYPFSTIVPQTAREYNLHLSQGEVCYVECKVGSQSFHYERQTDSVGKAAVKELKQVKSRFKD